MMSTYTITIEVEVHDPQELAKAAFACATDPDRGGMSEEEWRNLRVRDAGEPGIEALMPDGTRKPWDERLRTVGARMVDDEFHFVMTDLQMLFDSGVSPPGTQIIGSSVEPGGSGENE